MLQESTAPVIVAGGGIINADASELLVELAEILDVPVIPTLMGWGAIPDDHRLMAGMAGLQTAHQYGNATMLASDFVLGIGNRWANRHTGGLDTYRRGRTFVHVDIEPTQIGRVFAPDFGIVSDAARRAGPVRRGREGAPRAAARPPRLGRRVRQAQADDAAPHPLRRRPGQAAAGLRGDEPRVRPRHPLRQHDRAVPDRRRPVPARVQAPALDQRRAGRPARLDAAGGAGRVRRRSRRHRRRAVGRLRLPVHARGAGGRGAVPPALRPRRREQLLPRADPPVPARVRDGLLRPAVVRERQHPGARRLRRRPRQGGGGAGVQGDPGRAARRPAVGLRAGAQADGGVPRAGARRGAARAGHQHLHGHRARQHRRVRGARRRWTSTPRPPSRSACD